MEKDLVDRVNAYHLWEFIDENYFPYNEDIIYCPPDDFKSSGDVFAIRTMIENGKQLAYLFMKSGDGREFKWSEKQFYKNAFLGKDRYAVEIITPQMLRFFSFYIRNIYK